MKAQVLAGVMTVFSACAAPGESGVANAGGDDVAGFADTVGTDAPDGSPRPDPGADAAADAVAAGDGAADATADLADAETLPTDAGGAGPDAVADASADAAGDCPQGGEQLPPPFVTPRPPEAGGVHVAWAAPPWDCVSAWTLERSGAGSAGPWEVVAQVVPTDATPGTDGSLRFDVDPTPGSTVQLFRLQATTPAGTLTSPLGGISLAEEPDSPVFDVQGLRLARARDLMEAGLPVEEVLDAFRLTRSVLVTPQVGEAQSVALALSSAGLTDVRVESDTLVVGRLTLQGYPDQLAAVGALPGVASADIELDPAPSAPGSTGDPQGCKALLGAIGLGEHDATGLDYEAPPVVSLQALVLDHNTGGHGPAVGAVLQCAATLGGALGAPIVPLVPLSPRTGLLDAFLSVASQSFDILQVSISGLPDPRWSDSAVAAAIEDRLVVAAAGNFGYSSYFANLKLKEDDATDCPHPPCHHRHLFGVAGQSPYRLVVEVLGATAPPTALFVAWAPVDGLTLELWVFDAAGELLAPPESGDGGRLQFSLGPKAPPLVGGTYQIEVRWKKSPGAVATPTTPILVGTPLSSHLFTPTTSSHGVWGLAARSDVVTVGATCLQGAGGEPCPVGADPGSEQVAQLYSSRGPGVISMPQAFTAKPDLVAPTGLASEGGTSFAAPVVSGTAVLLAARLLAGSGAAMSPGERAETLRDALLSFRDPDLDPTCSVCLGHPHESVYGGGTLRVPPFRYTLTPMVSDSPSSDAEGWTALFGTNASKSTRSYHAKEEGACEERPHPCEFPAMTDHYEWTPVAGPALHLWLHARPVSEPGPPKLSSLDAKTLSDVHVVDARLFGSRTWEGTADGAEAALLCGEYKVEVSGKPAGGLPEACGAGASTPVPPLKEWAATPWAHFEGAIERVGELKKGAGPIGWTVSAPADPVYGPVLHAALAPQATGVVSSTVGPYVPFGATFEPVVYAEVVPTPWQEAAVVLMGPGQVPAAPNADCLGMHPGDYPGELQRTPGLTMRGSAKGPEHHVSVCVPSSCGTECD